MNFKPVVQIGEMANIVGCSVYQTNGANLWAEGFGRPVDYHVLDIKVEISLKTGETKYSYLLANQKEKNMFYRGGWVSGSSVAKAVEEEVSA